MLNEIPWPVPAPAAGRQRLRLLRRRAAPAKSAIRQRYLVGMDDQHRAAEPLAGHLLRTRPGNGRIPGRGIRG
jgi:hypothetical protein